MGGASASTLSAQVAMRHRIGSDRIGSESVGPEGPPTKHRDRRRHAIPRPRRDRLPPATAAGILASPCLLDRNRPCPPCLPRRARARPSASMPCSAGPSVTAHSAARPGFTEPSYTGRSAAPSPA
ncbi:DUF6053 domain-containing protein [Lysobacter enzymogenes]|uniref:DUF6053 domain-containing protein n=1 Tax=Lysobacter enzymogenes TaxID=69 RepID=UPI003D18C271